MLCYKPVISFPESASGGYCHYIAPDSGIVVCEAANDYRPRNPEDNLLYDVYYMDTQQGIRFQRLPKPSESTTLREL